MVPAPKIAADNIGTTKPVQIPVSHVLRVVQPARVMSLAVIVYKE